MTRQDWELLHLSELGFYYKLGDDVIVQYRCNWHGSRIKEVVGRLTALDKRGVEIDDHKRISYKAIHDMCRSDFYGDDVDAVAQYDGDGSIYWTS